MCNVDCHTIGRRLRPGEDRREGPVARSIEQQTAMPCDSIGVSLVMTALGQEKRATFIGQWGTALKACKAIRRILLRNQRA
jgi:hypothetical protein